MADEADMTTVADFTHAWMRRVEQKIDRSDVRLNQIVEILLRHDTRLGRVERDIHEAKGDIIQMENRVLNALNEILGVVSRVDETTQRIDEHQTKIESIERKLDRSAP